MTSSVGAAAFFLLFAGCEGTELGCGGLCENTSGAECTDTTVDECTEQCEEFEADVPAECRAAWEALRDCAAEAEWTCEAETCDRSESESCGSVPVLLGCSEEASEFESCGGGVDECFDEAGSGTATIDGHVVKYDYSSRCGRCDPPIEGALAGFACASETDCESRCCACGNRNVSVQVCIDGLCAGVEACDDSLGACDGFH
jgi:hypothetical protein